MATLKQQAPRKKEISPEARQQRSILTVLFLGVLIGALDIAIVGPALPAIGKSFNIDERSQSWIFTIYVLFSLVGSLIMGKLSDWFGRRNIFLINIGLFGIGSLIVAVSPNLAIMLVGRSLQGAAAGGIFPVASAVIGDTFPEERRGRALGLIGAVFGIAFLVGPILGGIILGLASWHWLFIINIPAALLVIWLGLRVLPAATAAHRQTGKMDLPGLAILAVMMTGLTIGINQLDTKNLVDSLTSVQVWPFLLVMLLSIPVFAVVERRTEHPVIPPLLVSSRQLIVAGVIGIGAGLGEAALVFIPNMAVQAFTVSYDTASYMSLVLILAMAFGSPLTGRLLDKFGSKTVLLGGSAILTVGLFLLAWIGDSLWGFFLSSIFIGLGEGGILGAPLRYIMLSEAPPHYRATAQSLIPVYSGIGQLLGGALVGAVIASMGSEIKGYMVGYAVVGFITLVTMLLTFGLKNKAQEKAGAGNLAAKSHG